jgi:hypothetical protein
MRVTIEIPSERYPSQRAGRNKMRTEVAYGPFHLIEDTDALARAAVAEQLAWYVQHSAAPNVVTFGAYTSVVYASPNGWYTVMTGPGCSGSHESGGRETFEEATARQRHLVVQRATHDWHDDTTVKAGYDFLRRHRIPESVTNWRPEEYLRYAGWQRAYRAAQSQGVAYCHEWASRHRGEHTPHFED